MAQTPRSQVPLSYTPGTGVAPPPMSTLGTGNAIPVPSGTSFPGGVYVGQQFILTQATSMNKAGLYYWNGSTWTLVGPAVVPLYTVTGTPFTGHLNSGNFTATAASTVVTLTNTNGFYTTGYGISAWNYTTHAAAVVSAQTLTSFTLTTVNGDSYFWFTFGF